MEHEAMFGLLTVPVENLFTAGMVLGSIFGIWAYEAVSVLIRKYIEGK